MKARAMIVAMMAGALSLGACEKKTAPAPTPNPAPANRQPTAAPATDALKNAGDTLKKEGEKAVDAAKKEGEKAVETAKQEGQKAVAALTDEVKKTVNGYIESLGKTNTLLEGIKSPLDATGKLPELGKSAGTVNGFSETLSKLTPEMNKMVKDQFGGQIEPLTKTFREQVDRITKDGALGKMLGDTLKSFKLFE